MEDAQRSKGILNLNKNAMIKNFRELEKQKVLDKIELQKMVQTWSKTVACRAVYYELYEKLSTRIRTRMMKMASIVIYKRMAKYFKGKLTILGETFEKRLRLHMKSSLTFSSIPCHRSCDERARRLFGDFMEKNSMISQFATKSHYFFTTINRISSSFKNRI